MFDHTPGRQTQYDANSDWQFLFVKEVASFLDNILDRVDRAAASGSWGDDADAFADELESAADSADHVARRAEEDDDPPEMTAKLEPLVIDYEPGMEPADVADAVREFVSGFAGDAADAFRGLAESVRAAQDPDGVDADGLAELRDRAVEFGTSLKMPTSRLAPEVRRVRAEMDRQSIGKAVRRYTVAEIEAGADGARPGRRGPEPASVAGVALKAVRRLAELARSRRRRKTVSKSRPAECPPVIYKAVGA